MSLVYADHWSEGIWTHEEVAAQVAKNRRAATEFHVATTNISFANMCSMSKEAQYDNYPRGGGKFSDGNLAKASAE